MFNVSLKRLFSLSGLLLIVQLPAQWSSSSTVNTMICGNVTHQDKPAITSDGAGGAIMVWQDSRNTSTDLYAQRVNALGIPQWTAHGIAICTAANAQELPTIISDGSGGAIITWLDSRSGTNYDVYAQRVNSAGAVLWTANGVAVSTATGDQVSPVLTTDGSGGAIIAWRDYRGGFDSDIYAQRVNSTGATMWFFNGISVCSPPAGDQAEPCIISDGANGAIISWFDRRNGLADIYAQRINSAGSYLWTLNGNAVCTVSGDQYNVQSISDGANGAIITWQDYRNSNMDVYAQRVNALGIMQWTTGGVPIATTVNNQQLPVITADGSGGALIAWQDLRSGTADVYAQAVNGTGTVQWTIDGVLMCSATSTQSSVEITGDGAGGAIVSWQDYRTGANDVYAQRVNAGAVIWATDGIAVCTAVNSQQIPVIVSDGSGGAILAWSDYRINPGGADIYAQHICAAGILGGIPIISGPVSGPTSICAGASVTYSISPVAGATGYTWTLPAGWSGSSTTNSISAIAGTAGGTISVTAVNGCGNSSPASLTVSVNNPPPAPSGIIGPASVCDGSTHTYSVAPVPGATSYTWTLPPGWTGSSLTNSISITAGNTGDTIYCTATNSCGASASVFLVIAVNTAPAAPSGISGTSPICAGSVQTCSVVPVAGASSYTWILPPGWSGTSVTNTITVTTNSGSGIISVTANNACGSSSPDSFYVTVNPLPAVALGNDTALCDATLLLDAGNPGATWLWNTNATSQTIAVSVSGTYSVSVTDVNGCTGTDVINITIHPLPVVDLGNDTSICGNSLTLNAANNGATYNWSTGETTQVIVANATGPYSVNVTDGNGCAGRDTVQINIHPLPVVDLGNDTAFCGVGLILDAANNGATYSWSTGAITQAVVANTTDFYSVSVTDSNGCTRTDSISVTLFSLPLVSLGNDSTQCGGGIVLDAGNAGATYVWSTGDTSQTLVATLSGNYAVTIIDGNGCRASDTINILIHTVPVVTYTETQSFLCLSSSPVTLSAGTPTGGTYSGTGVTGNTYDPMAADTGTHVIVYMYTDSNGCSSSDSSFITVDRCLGIDATSSNTISVNPNPCDGWLTVISGVVPDQILITDVLGNEVLEVIPVSDREQIDLNGLPDGIYFLTARCGASVTTSRIILAR